MDTIPPYSYARAPIPVSRFQDFRKESFSNTNAITTKTIVSAAVDQKRPVMAMTIPKTNAATNVPVRFPIPPTITTAKATSRM
jgi:hypothetical protein